MTDDLVAWLREQVDEDERAAQAIKESDRAWRLEETYSPDDGMEYDLDLGPGRDIKFVGWGHDISRAEAAHIARHDPARVLAEVAAKRRIIDLHRQVPGTPGTFDRDPPATGCEECHEWDGLTYAGGLCLTLRLLASVYAGRPGWRSEWAPDEEENRD